MLELRMMMNRRSLTHRTWMLKTRAIVRKRDGDNCWICNRLVPEGLPHGDADQATIDHVRERSRGGTDALPNLRLAHKYCNENRSAGPGTAVAV